MKIPAVTRFFDVVYFLFMSFCKLCFIGMVLIIAYVVFGRFVLNNSPVWGEPIVLMCMVYMSLISASLAIRRDTHIRMTIIDYLAPPRVINILSATAQIMIFGFSIFMIVNGWQFAMLAGKNVITGVGIKSMWLYLSVPLAGVALALMELERLINFIARHLSKRNP